MNTNKKTPKLRFKGFTDGWEQRKLGECMDSFEYGLNAAAKEYDGMHKYIRITDIDDETHNFIQSNLTSPDIDFNSDVSDYKLNVNDIVFARTGASVGKTYLYNQNDGDLYYAGFLIRGKVNEDCDAGFIYQNTLTTDYDSFIRITSQRSGQPGVNSKEYTTFRLNIPCKGEQEKISKLLNRLDKLFTLHQRKLEKLKLNKGALLQKLFPQKGCTIPDVRFKGFTDAWEQRKFGEIMTFLNGRAYKQDELLGDGKYKVLRVGNFYTNDSWYYSDLELDDKYYAMNGDLLYTWSATFGPHIWKGEKVIYHYHIWKLVLQDKIDKIFALQLLEVDKANIMSDKNGSTMVHITKQGMENKQTILPISLNEQKQIAKFLSSMDKLITLHQHKLDRLISIKKGLLQQLFV